MAFAPTNRADPLGFDMHIGPTPSGDVDITRDGRSCSGAELVRNGMIARSMANTIPMIGAPGDRVAFGKDVREWVGSAMTDDTIAERERLLTIVYCRDPRVDSGSVVVKIAAARAGAQYAFTITVSARTVTGIKIDLVMAIGDVTVEILANGAAS